MSSLYAAFALLPKDEGIVAGSRDVLLRIWRPGEYFPVEKLSLTKFIVSVAFGVWEMDWILLKFDSGDWSLRLPRSELLSRVID